MTRFTIATTKSETRIRMTDKAATAASAEFSTYLSTCTGGVGSPDSATNSEMSASSKETMKAMTPPAITPGWMMGRVDCDDNADSQPVHEGGFGR
jgi:hypothetical protein